MTTAADGFEAYDSSHLAVLAIFVVGIAVVVLAGRRWRGTDVAVRVSRVGAVAVLAVTVPLQIAQLLPGEWDLDTSLPLQICDFAWMVAVHALWTQNRLTATLTWLWGTTLTLQGMLTPDLASPFPEPRFVMFWAMHVLIIWAAFWLVPGLGRWPSWRTYRQTLGITLGYLAAVFVVNIVLETNYGYVNRKPSRASALDLLPDWPWYLAIEIAVVAAVWALLTWPCVVAARRAVTSRRARPARSRTADDGSAPRRS